MEINEYDLTHPKIKRKTERPKSVIDDAFELPDSDRNRILGNLAENYFMHYGIEMPDDILGEKFFIPLIYPDESTKKEIEKALKETEKYAADYHVNNTPRITIPNDVTKFTLLKLFKKTPYGARLDEMGIGDSSTNNIKNMFIAKPVLDFIVHRLFDKEPLNPEIEREFGKNKASFIASQLKKLLEEE